MYPNMVQLIIANKRLDSCQVYRHIGLFVELKDLDVIPFKVALCGICSQSCEISLTIPGSELISVLSLPELQTNFDILFPRVIVKNILDH